MFRPCCGRFDFKNAGKFSALGWFQSSLKCHLSGYTVCVCMHVCVCIKAKGRNGKM